MTTKWDMSLYSTSKSLGVHTFSRHHWKQHANGRTVHVFFHHESGPNSVVPVSVRPGWYCGFEGTNPPDWCGPFKLRKMARLTAELLP